jgi:hypothetical protein
MKRRVIYMDDETWGVLANAAGRANVSISDYVRRAVSEVAPLRVATTPDALHVDLSTRLRPSRLSERPVTAVPKPASAAETRRRR